ncbi:hypothetical protein [Clostridium sp.]|uniref:hypothetical protein n=1 Tax=Clostridium sp. TaxID=1506 RepID=UPI0039927A91
MGNNSFFHNFIKLLNDENFNIYEIEKNNIFRNRLLFFLKTMGYGYAALGILRRLLNKGENNIYEIIEILEDCNLKESFNIMEGGLEEVIYYNKNIGMNKSYEVDYNNALPVEKILWSSKEFINCHWDKNKILININIPPYSKAVEKRNEVIAVLFGNFIKKYSFKLRENNFKDMENKFTIPKRVIKIKKKLNFGNFPLYDLILLESEFLKVPFITTEVIEILKKLYFRGYYSEETIDVIKIMKKTLDKDIKNEGILFIEAKFKNFNTDFLRRFTEISKNNNSDKVDFIINKIINNKFEFYEPFLQVIYSFYKRNNDINALLKYIEICEVYNIDMYKYGFKAEDKIKIKIYINNLKKMGYTVNLNKRL